MKVLIFGGTTEGRRLTEALRENSIDVTLSVATEYGRSLVIGSQGSVIAQRLTHEEITLLLQKNNYDYVIDATHPYAYEVTENIKASCTAASSKYLRLKRQEGGGEQAVIHVNSAKEAAELLKDTTGNILLTTGSKDLDCFTSIKDYSKRIYVRILPMADSLNKAISLGFGNSNIICMQGPFDIEMNIATIKMAKAAYMVTKDSGREGGFSQKLAAAEKAWCKVIVISRPSVERGYGFDEILRLFNIKDNEETKPFTFFPLFIDLKGRNVAVIGGGKIAQRRIKALQLKGADITVISPNATDFINQLAEQKAIKHENRCYQKGDVKGCFLVIAATNDRQVNHMVMEEAKSEGALAIISDNREECDCFFPAIAENDCYISGVVSKNGNHRGTAELAENFRRLLTNEKDC